MEKEEELKNMELEQDAEGDMEGEGYEEDFDNEDNENLEQQMEGEYDEEEQEGDPNPYDQDDAIRNTFYPSQNPIMGSGFGGALRPVSANVPKDRNRKNRGYGGKNRIAGGFSKGLDSEFDVRTRPKRFLKDKEGLYDDAIKLKKAYNGLKTENTRYKTRIKKLETELLNQQREMDEYIMSQNQGRLDYGLNYSYVKNQGSHITHSLKNQVKELKSDMKKKDEEMTKIKRSLKATNIQELEVEMKLYVDECTRLRHMLEESYKNMMDPNEMAKIEERFQMQDNYLVNLQTENQELAETCAKMQQILQNQQEDSQAQSKLKNKLNKILGNKKKLSKNLKLKEKELNQLKKDLTEARRVSKGGGSSMKTLNERLNKYQKELDDKNSVIDRLRDDAQLKNDTIAQLREEIEELKNQAYVQEPVESQERIEQNFQPEPIAQSKQEKVEEVDEDDDYNDDEYDDEYKDDVDQQDPNIIDDDAQEVKDDDKDEPRGESKAIISEIDADPLFEKLKLLMQRNNIPYNNMSQLFPKDITIMSLEHKLKSLGMKDAEERLILCRYIIEPRSDKMIEFIETRGINNNSAENVLKSKIDNYELYQDDEKDLINRIRNQVKRYSNTLREALELEDLDGTGFIPANALKSCFLAMDLSLDDDLIQYLVYYTGSFEKIGRSNSLMLEYEKMMKLIQGGTSEQNDANEDPQDYSDDYANDFEDKVDDSGQIDEDIPAPVESKPEQEEVDDYDLKQTELQQNDPQKPTEEGEGLDQEFDDEEMISIAENCLIKIAEELLNKRITVRQLFSEDIIDEEIEGEKIELLLPLSFLEGLKKLQMEDFSEIEIA